MTVYVYRLYGAQWDLIYVGSGKGPAKRLADHRRQQPWGTEMDRQTSEPYADRADAEFAEAVAIFSEFPPYNVLWNSNRARPLIYNLDGP